MKSILLKYFYEKALAHASYMVLCRTRGRSAVGASMLQVAGAKKVINLAGGITQWASDGLPINK